MTLRWLAALACALAWQRPPGTHIHAAPRCQDTLQPVAALPGRIDSLLVTETSVVMALIGHPGSTVRFLPHDLLEVGRIGRSGTRLQPIPLPSYLAAPGLAAHGDGTQLYALVDSMLLTIDGASGRLIARQDLHLQAVGWPAAVTAGSDGELYLVGQPAGAMAAQAYAFTLDARHTPRLRWVTALGPTHADTWIGPAGNGRLAVYVPDQHDAQGEMLLLDRTRGRLRLSYAVSLPPIAVAPSLERLYLAGAGSIRAVTLAAGAPAATVAGGAPLAASSAYGLVAFVRAGRLVIARADNLRTLLVLGFPEGTTPTALAWQGRALLIGNARGIARLQLNGCAP